MRGGYRLGAGRKRGFSALTAEETRSYIARRVGREQRPIIDKAIEQAREGNAKAREWLYERGFGRTPTATPIEEEAGKRIIVHITKYGSKDKDTPVESLESHQ